MHLFLSALNYDVTNVQMFEAGFLSRHFTTAKGRKLEHSGLLLSERPVAELHLTWILCCVNGCSMEITHCYCPSTY